jgi:hypothetical protein
MATALGFEQIGSLCVMREAATVVIQVHGFVWALHSACPMEVP